MGWLADLLKEIPLSVFQQQKIAQMEAQYAAMEAEKASLKDDLRHAKAEIAKLKKQIEDAHTEDLDPFDINILQVIAIYTAAPAELIAEDLKSHFEKVTLHLNDLLKVGYVEWQLDIYQNYNYRLSDKARRYLINNNLLPPSP